MGFGQDRSPLSGFRLPEHCQHVPADWGGSDPCSSQAVRPEQVSAQGLTVYFCDSLTDDGSDQLDLGDVDVGDPARPAQSDDGVAQTHSVNLVAAAMVRARI